jgi:hypothetical protein
LKSLDAARQPKLVMSWKIIGAEHSTSAKKKSLNVTFTNGARMQFNRDSIKANLAGF